MFYHRLLDYVTDYDSFKSQLAQDAVSFKPFGEKIGEYRRPSASSLEKSKGKGKEVRKRGIDDLDDEGDVVYEMWKVSRLACSDCLRWTADRCMLPFGRRAWLIKSSERTIDACRSSSCCTLREEFAFRFVPARRYLTSSTEGMTATD